jgi:hypothetical protein
MHAHESGHSVKKAGFSGSMVKLPPFFHKLYRFFLHALL